MTKRKPSPTPPRDSAPAESSPPEYAPPPPTSTDHRRDPVEKRKRKPDPKPADQPSAPLLEVANEEDETSIEKISRASLRNLPPALISFILHLVVIIVFALIYIPGEGSGRLSLVLETDSLDDAFDQTFELAQEDEFSPEIQADQLELSSTESLQAFEPELAAIEPTAPTPLNPATDPNFALSGRGENNREGLLARFGGSPATENAVELGLQWLARNQLKDGSWSLKGPYRSLVGGENKMAATGLALLAFLGHGETHQQGKYQRVVADAVDYLIKNQSGNGHFVDRTASLSHSLYTHAICSISICELLALTQDERLAGPAREAIAFAVQAQGPQGGWRYEVAEARSDLSVTGWFVMLFQSAKYAGIEYDPAVLQNAEKFLDLVMLPDGSRYRYQVDHEPAPSMTAEGLLCRQYLGWKRDDPRMQAGVEYLMANPLRWSQKNSYYWYYATQVLRNMEDETWNQWNDDLKKVLTEKQRQTGADKGSWDPEGDPYGGVGGRLYMTCLCIYSLEVYYRHLPIYRMSNP